MNTLRTLLSELSDLAGMCLRGDYGHATAANAFRQLRALLAD